ncbi:MAG: sigma 54-interacting transcriptional regulator, partial [Myxococcales bacterium]|nr:sigma 54-interacting transcriptional regulator [Myxococcales bacterium]
MNEEVTWSRVLPQAAAGEERLVLLWDSGSLTRPLSQGDDLVIGRSRSAADSVDHKSVSREHARVRLAGGGVEIVDLGSSNGTRVSGASIRPNQPMQVPLGALVQLGSVVLVVEQAAAPSQVAPEQRSLGQRMQELGQLIASVAASDISVVLCGETGVGKDVMASQIHARSRRARHPLVRLNCAALAENLLESELFGHERGAFTGAVQSKQGLLEAASGGSIFFDEVGEMPLGVQAKLLRAIEQREVYRVGGVRPVSFDVRFIAATNRELDREILEGRFRRDLYFRLAGITLQIPPLRERLDELPSLVQTFVTEHATRSRVAPPAVSAAALQRLMSHPWPGNLRELKNVIERAVVLSGGGTIDVHHIHIDPVAAALGNSEGRSSGAS